MIAENLLRQVAEHGCRLDIADDRVTCRVLPKEPGHKLPDRVMDQVRAGKRHLLALCVCSECERVTTDLEDIDRLRSGPNPFCDSGSCPYKPRRKW
jgi:hypothetical protein